MKTLYLLIALSSACMTSLVASETSIEYAASKRIQSHRVWPQPMIRPSVFQKELTQFEDYLDSIKSEDDNYTLNILFVAHDELTIHLHLNEPLPKDHPSDIPPWAREGCNGCEQVEREKKFTRCLESNEAYIVGLQCTLVDGTTEVRLFTDDTLPAFTKKALKEFRLLNSKRNQKRADPVDGGK